MPLIYEPSGKALEYSLLSLNHYVGCPHGCTYCYVPTMPGRNRADFHAKAEPKKDLLAKLGKNAKRYAGTDKRVLLSFASDPYPQVDARLALTRRVLSLLIKHDIPFTVLTKGGMLAARDFDLYRPDLDAFAVTLTAATDRKWRQMACEPNAAPPSDRIETLKEAHARGIETWVSLEPVIDPEESLKIITATYKYVDLYKVGTLNHVTSDMTSEQWADFARRAIDICTACKVEYFIKHDLARHKGLLGELQAGNFDNRTANR